MKIDWGSSNQNVCTYFFHCSRCKKIQMKNIKREKQTFLLKVPTHEKKKRKPRR